MSKKINHDERRQEIARKALKLFSQVGYENVSLIMIAAATGISRTVLYRYFCSKREVMEAAIQTASDEVQCRCAKIILGRTPAMQRLEKVCHTVVDVMFENRDFVIAIFDYVMGFVRTGADMTHGIRHYTSGTRGAIEALVRHAKKRGEIPEILIVERTSDVIYTEFESCAMRIVLGTERDPRLAKVRFSDIVRALTIWK